jgi:hypothetical protein
MSDPKKNFICPKCGFVVNDMQRHQGSSTPCEGCFRIEVREKYSSRKDIYDE